MSGLLLKLFFEDVVGSVADVAAAAVEVVVLFEVVEVEAELMHDRHGRLWFKHGG